MWLPAENIYFTLRVLHKKWPQTKFEMILPSFRTFPSHMLLVALIRIFLFLPPIEAIETARHYGNEGRPADICGDSPVVCNDNWCCSQERICLSDVGKTYCNMILLQQRYLYATSSFFVVENKELNLSSTAYSSTITVTQYPPRVGCCEANEIGDCAWGGGGGPTATFITTYTIITDIEPSFTSSFTTSSSTTSQPTTTVPAPFPTTTSTASRAASNLQIVNDKWGLLFISVVVLAAYILVAF